MHCIDSYFYTTVFQITFITNFVIFTILYFILYKSKLAVIEKPAIEEKCINDSSGIECVWRNGILYNELL